MTNSGSTEIACTSAVCLCPVNRFPPADRTGHFHFSFLLRHTDMLTAAFAGEDPILLSHGKTFFLQTDKVQIFIIFPLPCRHISGKNTEQRINDPRKSYDVQDGTDGFQRQDIQYDGYKIKNHRHQKCDSAQIVISISSLQEVGEFPFQIIYDKHLLSSYAGIAGYRVGKTFRMICRIEKCFGLLCPELRDDISGGTLQILLCLPDGGEVLFFHLIQTELSKHLRQGVHVCFHLFFYRTVDLLPTIL